MSIFAAVYRAAASALCVSGILINTGVFFGKRSLQSFVYYTTLSNVLCLFMWLAGLFGATLTPAIRGGAAIAILLTMVVYHFLLSREHTFEDSYRGRVYRYANAIVHYVVPILMLADFLFLPERGAIPASAPAAWVWFPLAYFVFAVLRAKFIGTELQGSGGSKYPYFFIDPEGNGILKAPQRWSGVMLNALAIFAAYMIAGYLLMTVNNLIVGI